MDEKNNVVSLSSATSGFPRNRTGTVRKWRGVEMRRNVSPSLMVVEAQRSESPGVLAFGGIFCKYFLLGREVTYNKTYKSTLLLR